LAGPYYNKGSIPTSIKLSDTQLVMLSAAAQRDGHCLTLPEKLKGAAAHKVATKLIAADLVTEFRPRRECRSGDATRAILCSYAHCRWSGGDRGHSRRRRESYRRRRTTARGRPTESDERNRLIRSIASARSWPKELVRGSISDVAGLAARENRTPLDPHDAVARLPRPGPHRRGMRRNSSSRLRRHAAHGSSGALCRSVASVGSDTPRPA
jgi:hypothetical protein